MAHPTIQVRLTPADIAIILDLCNASVNFECGTWGYHAGAGDLARKLIKAERIAQVKADGPSPYRAAYGRTFKGGRKEDGRWTSVLDNRGQGAGHDTGKDRWAVVCETHATLLACPTLREARFTVGSDFCDGCREAIFEGSIRDA